MSDVEQVKTQVTDAADKAKKLALAAYEKAKEEGFFSHIMPYTQELLMPWTLITTDEGLQSQPDVQGKAMYLLNNLKTEVIAASTLSPATPEPSFKMYNVIGFWLGVFESLIFAFFGHGFLSLAWNGALGFAIAYTLFWTMTCFKQQKFMFYSLILIALYVLFNVYMGMKTLIFVVPSALYFGKALCDALMLVNGFVLYKAVVGDGSLVPADALQMM
jgi:hypothetical protein